MTSSELIAYVLGVLRFGLPLAATTVAALMFLRTRVVNIAIDGQIALAAIVYVAISEERGFLTSAVGALVASMAIGVALTITSRVRAVDTILVSFGFYYISLGIASVFCTLTAGNPGNAPMRADRAGGEWIAGGILLSALVVTIVALQEWRSLRVAKVIGELEGAGGVSLTELSGIRITKWMIVHSLIGSALLAVVAVYLVEQGGGYTKMIAGERGFLALAIVAVCRHSIRACIAITVGFGVTLRLATESTDLSDLARAIPFIFLLGILAALGFRHRTSRGDSLSAARRLIH